MLVSGTTAVIRHAVGCKGRASPWPIYLLKRKPLKLAAVALANKLARIAWKLMVTGETYAATSAPIASAATAQNQSDTGSNLTATVLSRRQNLQGDEQMVCSIDPRRGILRGPDWPQRSPVCLEPANP